MPEPRSRPLVLHVTGEYPDPLRNRTTPAVKNFIDRLPDVDHLIVSLKRQGDPRKTYLKCFDSPEGAPNQKIVAHGYWAPPGGMLHRWSMRRVGRTIGRIIDAMPCRPTLVMAHKLAVEGVIARHLQRRFDLPYICLVRGEVEDKFFRFKPELKRLFGEVVEHAEGLYFVSAWFRRRIEERYPGLMRSGSLLPNFVATGFQLTDEAPDPNALVTVMDLHVYRRKGLPELLRALALARRTNPALRLDIIGWSSPSLVAAVRRLISRNGLDDAVRLIGFVENREVLRRLPRYAGFVLPAHRETFGMAYVEALLVGVPVLHGKDSGIDGYLDGLDVSVAVPLGDIPALADGIRRLATDAPRLRAAIRRQHDEIRRRFEPEDYLERFRGLLARLQLREGAIAHARAEPADDAMAVPARTPTEALGQP